MYITVREFSEDKALKPRSWVGATVPHLMPHPKTSHFPSSLVLQLLLCDRASVFVLGLVCFLVTRTGLLSYFVWHVFHVYYEFD